jgi:succinate dehydrogenase/fumarate reductase-like Fe-S protein
VVSSTARGETSWSPSNRATSPTASVWQCHTQFSCTDVCPKDIPITEEIQELKRESVKQNLKIW